MLLENAQADIVQKLNTSLSSGTTTGMPNIVLIEDYRIQSFLEAYPDAFLPVTDLINADDFADYKITAGTVDGGKLYSVPFDTGVTGLYVRTDVEQQVILLKILLILLGISILKWAKKLIVKRVLR